MKILSREFTSREKILIFALIVIILALCYYKFVHIPISDAISNATAEQYQLQDEEVIMQAKAMQTIRMREELDEIGEDAMTVMPSYNASKSELALLNEVLKDTSDYTIKFASVTREGNQIRRNFTLNFKMDSYDSCKKILSNLINSGNRVLIDDMAINNATRRLKDETVSEITCNLSATFFETMVGGTPDAGLPADNAA